MQICQFPDQPKIGHHQQSILKSPLHIKTMNNNHHSSDAFYDQSTMRIPLSNLQQQQQQTLHRQPSRQFDAYGQMPVNLYTNDDNMSRYEPGRFDRMRPAVRGDSYGYEVLGAQTWNPNAFSGNSNFPAFGATGRMKSASRGRSAIPSVSTRSYLRGYS